MAAMVSHSRRHRIWQSANIMGDCCLCQRQEWGTMAAAIGHLGHNALTDIAGWLWVVLYVEIHRLLHQAISDTLSTRWQRAFLLAWELLAQQPPHQICHCVVLSKQQHHWGMMHGSSGSKIGGRRAGGDNSYNRWVCTSIDHGGRQCPTATMGPHSRLLSIQQSASIVWNRSTSLKLEKTIINNV